MLTAGTDLTITASRLGTLATPHARGFEPEVAVRGSRATYVSRHPDDSLSAQGWHLVLVIAEDLEADDPAATRRPLFCPVHEGQFETRAGRVPA